METRREEGLGITKSCRSPVQPAEPLERLRALGFGERDAGILAAHYSTQSSGRRRAMGSHGSTGSPSRSSNQASPKRLLAEPGFERWDGNGALGYLALAEICDAQIASPPEHAPRRRFELLSHGRARVLDAEAGRRGPRRLADRDVAGQARTP